MVSIHPFATLGNLLLIAYYLLDVPHVQAIPFANVAGRRNRPDTWHALMPRLRCLFFHTPGLATAWP